MDVVWNGPLPMMPNQTQALHLPSTCYREAPSYPLKSSFPRRIQQSEIQPDLFPRIHLQEQPAPCPSPGQRKVCVQVKSDGQFYCGRLHLRGRLEQDSGPKAILAIEIARLNRHSTISLGDRFPLHHSHKQGWTFDIKAQTETQALASSLEQRLQHEGLEVTRSDLVTLISSLSRSQNGKKLANFIRGNVDGFPDDLGSVVWHPSAGVDFSPLVAFSRGYLESKQAFRELSPATFHVMTCLGWDESHLMALLESKDRILFEDHLTRIHLVDHQLVELFDDSLWRRPSKRNYHHRPRIGLFRENHSDGFLATVELTCKRTGYRERVPVLYLLAENIATYKTFVRGGDFQVRHIKATCEGLAFGGCGRSLIDHLCLTGQGLDTLESIWLGRDSAERKLKDLPPPWAYHVTEMPGAFTGHLARIEKEIEKYV